MTRRSQLLTRTALVSLLACASAGAVTVGMTDTFQNGTTQGWGIGGGGSPNLPSVVLSGGPGGAGDNYLQLIATGGGGPGSKLTAINESQWAGDYVASGLKFITMDVNNFGPDDLMLRLLFADPAGGPPSNIAVSTNAVSVAAGSGWQHIVFDIQPGALTATAGTVLAALSGATELRIFHNTVPDYPPPPTGPPAVNVTLGVDNISAVPEPGTMLVAGAGLVALFLRRKIMA